MDAYTYKCPGCGAGLEFDINSQLLVCDSCGQMYAPGDIPGSDYKAPKMESAFHFTSPLNVQDSEQSNNQTNFQLNENSNFVLNSIQEFDSNMGLSYTQPENASDSATNTGSIFSTLGAEQNNAYTNNPYAEQNNTYTNDPYAQADEYMEVNIYHCASCGSELMTNDVEVSKFCSFCGQSAIMFDRVSKEKKPQKIIPFSITKEAAISKAKFQFGNAKFMPDTVNNITIESVYGIYMPYYVYKSSMTLAADVTVKSNDRTRTYEGIESMVHETLLDASKKFNDDVSKNLNPFSLRDAVDFTPAFLSGFYADRSDVAMESRVKDAEAYIEEILTERIYDQVPGAPSRQMRELYSGLYSMGGFKFDVTKKEFQLQSCEYIFCPVYFITFHVGDELAIILVNGSNGKVVGSVPIDKEKVKKRQNIDMIVNAALFGIAGALLFRFMPVLWSAMFVGILGGSMIYSGLHAKKKYEEMHAKTNSKAMFDLSKNREN